MMRRIDLNADLGEGGSEDELLLGLVSSCNIACGGHAGSDEIMRRTLAHALAAGVAIGAHPGYEDRENFGRRELQMTPQAVTELVVRQVGKLAALAQETGASLDHVKPHGALYHQANRDLSLAAAARAAGVIVRAEGFADRRYQNDGSLQPRSQPGAVIEDPAEAVAQALALAGSGRFETLCVHGDGAHAATLLRAVRSALENAGFRITR